MDVLLDDHVPLVVGVTMAVPPTQTILSPPNIGILGILFIFTTFDEGELQPLTLVIIKVKLLSGERLVTVKVDPEPL
jgi:hypothetical protein